MDRVEAAEGKKQNRVQIKGNICTDKEGREKKRRIERESGFLFARVLTPPLHDLSAVRAIGQTKDNN